jgi:hypothetical protein
VEILLWLVPPAVVTVVAMLWVSWLGRERRGEVDPEVAVRRLAQALQKEPPAHTSNRPTPNRDRSTGIAVRPSRSPAAGHRTPGEPRRSA